jgi:hypothetical protein
MVHTVNNLLIIEEFRKRAKEQCVRVSYVKPFNSIYLNCKVKSTVAGDFDNIAVKIENDRFTLWIESENGSRLTFLDTVWRDDRGCLIW